MQVRTLPIRVLPLPGEALDSWLEAVSSRMDTPLGQLLEHLGFPARTQQYRGPQDRRPPDWTIMLRDHEADRLGGASGLAPEVITAMTLARYFPHAVNLDGERRHVDRKILWGRGSGSRYCPDCLREHGGRWLLFWRLGWAFACTRHRRLLADCCPDCGRVPRHRPHSGRSVPCPGSCGNAPLKPGAPHTRGCGSVLEKASTLPLHENHPALLAQRQIEELTETPAMVTTGAYIHAPQQSRQVLMDIRAVAQRVLADLPREYFPALLPDDLATAYLACVPDVSGPHQPGPGYLPPGESAARPGFMAPARATSTAVATTLALHILNDPDVRTGGSLVRTIHQARRRQLTQPVIASSIEDWGRGLSPVLEAIHLAAIAPGLRPSGQLRYHTASTLPRRPNGDDRAIRQRARKTPSVFWPEWAVRLLPPPLADEPMAGPALATSLMVIGNPHPLQVAAERLGAVITGYQTSLILRRLDKSPNWHHLVTSLNSLADYLDSRSTPIDYERRRQLDYRKLLSPERWTQISEHTAVPDRKGRHASAVRRCLVQQISGLPTRTARDARFLARLNTPDLAAALDDEASSFLAAHHIHNEPVTWVPPDHLLPKEEMTRLVRHNIDDTA